MNFCRRCGSTLTHVKDHVYTCENNHTLFANSSPSVGVFFVTQDNQVLLSVRGIEPHKGMLDAFGGFLDGVEIFEHAVRRELEEELGLTSDDYTKPEYLTSGVGNYPYKGEVLPVISAFFWARLLTDTLTPQDDVAEVMWLSLNDIDYTKLHDEDIVSGIKALQAKLL